MAGDVDTYVREILDNVQVIEATRKAAQEEKILAKVREASGAAGVKAYKQVQAEAAKAAKEAERAAKGPSAWTQALQANTEAVKDSSKELNDFRGKVNQSAESLGKIGAALSVISPEIGSFVTTAQQGIGAVSGLSGAMGTLGAALPPVAIAGSLVAAGFYDLEQQNKALREESDRLTKQLDKLKDGLEGIRDVEAELIQRELTLADPNAAKHLEATTKAAEKYAPQVSVVKEELGRAREAQRKANAELERWTTGLDAQAMAQDVVTRHQRDAQKALDDATAAVAAQEAQLQGLNEAQGSLAGRLITVTTREKEAKDAKERTKDAEKDATEAARERERVEAMLLKILQEQADAEIKRSETLATAKASLEEMKRASEEALATDEERIRMAAQASREAAVAAANEAQAASDSAEERKRIAKDLSETLINIKADETAKIQAIDEEEAKKAKDKAAESAEALRDKFTDVVGSIGDISDAVFGAITEAQDRAVNKATDRVEDLQEAYDEAVSDGEMGKAKALKAQLETAKEGALAAFEAQKKTAVQQAVVQGVLGVATAAASAPPPANLIPMGIATIIGATQVAAAKAVPPPEFDDTPEAMMARNMQPARAQVSLHRDDIFIAGKTPESVVNQAAGLAGGGSSWRRSFGPKLAQGTLTLLTRDVRRAARGRIRG